MTNKVIKIESFTRPGSALKANEDNCFVSNNFGFVIDGATGKNKVKITNDESDAKWFSNSWKEFLIKNLANHNLTISEIVKKGIVEINNQLKQFENYAIADLKPSAAIAIFRVNENKIEYFVLADCSLVVTKKDGTTTVITKDDITMIDGKYLNLIKTMAIKNNLSMLEAKKLPEVNKFAVKMFKNRNTENGGWVLSNSLEAVDNAKIGFFILDEVKSIIGLSDGFSQIYDLFNHVTPEKLSNDLANGSSLENYYNTLFNLQNEDKDCEVYLRSKIRDDATAIKFVIEQ